MKNLITTSTLALGMLASVGFTTPALAESAQGKINEALSCWDSVGAKANIDNFDDLDFNVFTNQKWDQLHKSHAKDVIVNWPDGHATHGIDVHIEDLQKLFVFAPDTRILEHPIRIACGNLTAVMGYMEGTFTQPMPIGGGKTIEPTGKSFRIQMATIGKWQKDGPMTEEWLFWDNQTYMNQLGLGQ